jgi:hypothetical protein
VPHFAIGDRVSQAQYGHGTVRFADQYHTIIDFDEPGLRKFSTPVVTLERSSTVEPGKPAKPARRKAAPKVPGTTKVSVAKVAAAKAAAVEAL